MIHNTSIISKNAHIGNNVNIGPFCTVGDNVIIGDNNKLVSHVCIDGNTNVGYGNIFYPFSSIGLQPQDKKFSGEKSSLNIGNNNIIRENVTINPGTLGGGMLTKIHNNCLIMIGSHIAHDCNIHSNVILVNNSLLAGHVTIQEGAIIGGCSAIHQFVNIGKYAMIGGMSGVESNIIPYGMYSGIRSNLRGLNLIGLKRLNLKSVKINKIKIVFEKIFKQDNNLNDNIINLSNEELKIKEISEIIDFINKNFKRGICRYFND